MAWRSLAEGAQTSEGRVDVAVVRLIASSGEHHIREAKPLSRRRSRSDHVVAAHVGPSTVRNGCGQRPGEDAEPCGQGLEGAGRGRRRLWQRSGAQGLTSYADDAGMPPLLVGDLDAVHRRVEVTALRAAGAACCHSPCTGSGTDPERTPSAWASSTSRPMRSTQIHRILVDA